VTTQDRFSELERALVLAFRRLDAKFYPYTRDGVTMTALANEAGISRQQATWAVRRSLKFVRRVGHTRRGRNLWRLIASERLEVHP